MKKYKNKNWLKQKYLTEKLSMSRIAKICDVSSVSIYYFLKKFQIKTRHKDKIGKGKEPWNKNLTGIYSHKTRDSIAKNVSQAWKDGRLGKWQKSRPKFYKNCLECDKKFQVYKSRMDRHKFCSKECQYKWLSKHRRGKLRTESWKDLPERKCLNCDKIFRVKALWKLETHNFCSRKCRDEYIKGPNHHQWTGGSTLRQTLYHRKENIDWRKTIFERDDYVCQKCGSRNGFGKAILLRAHHIKNWKDYPKSRYTISNGITFCKKCHNEFHKTYGYRNNNKKQLIEFLNL